MIFYTLSAFVYCHTKDLSRMPYLEEKAIKFAQQRNMQIKGFCATDVYNAIRLFNREKINVLLINNHTLTDKEHQLLMSYCRQKNIALVYFEKER